MPIRASRLDVPAPALLPLEIVARKGPGHPDTFCDAICDAIAQPPSVALSRRHLDRFGRVLHHNVDEALPRGGAVRSRATAA